MFTSIFGFLFIVLIIILLFGVSIISSILKALFGMGKRSGRGASSQRTERPGETYTENPGTETGKKKIFEKDEGEYVDFEEIKDNEQQ